MVGLGNPGVPQQVGIDPVPRRRLAGAGTPVDGPQPHDSHQPLHPFSAYRYILPVQPGLHPPRPASTRRRGLQVLPVHLADQGQVLFRSCLETVIEGGTANDQQGALRQLRVFPVHHLPSASRLQVSLTAPRPRMYVVSNATLMPGSQTPGPASGWTRIPPAPCRAGSTGRGTPAACSWRRAGPPPQFPPTLSSECRSRHAPWPRLPHLVVGLRRRQQAGRHAVPTTVGTVELDKILVSKQLPPRRGQQAVESVPPHVVQIQSVRFPKAPLIRIALPASPTLAMLVDPSIVASPAAATFRPDF